VCHFSDPVAYRIESLLLSPDLSESELPPPMYLTLPGRDVRLHVKAMQLSDVVRKSFLVSKNSGWGALLESAVAVVGNQSETYEVRKRGEEDGKVVAMTFPLGGRSSRVDFSLQPGVVETEYIRYVFRYTESSPVDFMIANLTLSSILFSAVTAHSSYFTNADIQEFLICLVAASHDTCA
jgi:hypothetical protein